LTLQTQKLGKQNVVMMSILPGSTVIKLRQTPQIGEDVGFDLEVTEDPPGVRMVRMGTQGEEAAPYEVQDQRDAQKLHDFSEKLVREATDLYGRRARLLSADLDGRPFVEDNQPAQFVERLIQNLTPTVQEIARRSSSRAELIIRRQ